MTLQTVSQIVLLFGVLLSALGGFGSYWFGKTEERENRRKATETQQELKQQVAKLQLSFDNKTDLIFQALKVKQDVWIAVETNTVPPTTAYLLLIFKSDKGRMSGKVRIKGSEEIAYFSTTANDTVPVAVPNLWLAKERQYKMPTVIEFSVKEKTIEDSTLNIFTLGWIDDLGQEPH